MTQTVDHSNRVEEAQHELLIKQFKQVEELVPQYISDVKLPEQALKTNRGKLLVAITDDGGNVLKEADIYGDMQRCVFPGDQTWQTAGAINTKLHTVPGATKFMAWRWDDTNGRYIPDRSKIEPNGWEVKVGNWGTIDRFIVNHVLSAKRAPSTTLPGVAELDFLRQECAAQLKHAREHVSQENKAPKGLAKDAGDKVTSYWAGFMRTQHTHDGKLDVRAVVTAIGKYFPELAPKQQ